MNLEFSFKTNSSARPQNRTLQEGESIQVFSGESFQIQNPEVVARLVPQDKDLQIVCHDGTSFILKNFLEVDFATEPVLELQGGTPITRHDFLQQTEEIDQDFHIGDINNPTFAFAPLLVIATTAKSPEWSFAKMPLSEEESSETTVQNPQSPRSNSPQPKEKYAGDDDSSFSKATTQNIEEVGIKLAPNRSEDSQSDNIAEANANSVATDFIEIDILKFLDFNNEGIDPPLSITGTIVGDGGTEIEIDDSTGIAIIPKDIFKDDNSVNINIIVDDGIGTKNTTITITETKDGGGETFHLILSQNQVVENREGALIGKLDTDDAGRNHTYEYTLSKDSSNLFEIEGNVLKLKNDVSIDYEAHSESYIIRIVAIDETGHKIEQSMDVWPKDVNEIASLSSIDISTLEDVRVIFDPEDFDNAFEDEDNDYLETIRMDTLPENGTLSLGDNPVTIGQLIDYEQIEDLSFQPNPNWNEGTSFNWSGFDGSAWSAESSLVSISIEAVNDAPIVSVNIGQQLADIGEVLTMNLPEDAFIDIDNGDTLSYSSELPGWLNVDSETGTISGTPTDEHIGDQDITITATDASGKSTSQTFRLNIENINDAPTFTQISNLETDEDASFKLEASDHFNDKDLEYGDTLNYTATLEDGSQLPIWLSIDPQSGTLSGTPENEDVESLNIRITASDGEAQSEQTFSLQINNTNDGPTVVADIVDQTVDEDAAFSLDVSGNFSDEDIGDELAFSATLENGDPLPTWLSIDSATGELSGTPDNGDVGAINVTVTASDGTATVDDTFALAVDNTNDGPTVSTVLVSSVIADLSIDEDAAFSLDVTSNFADEDIGDTFTFSATLQGGGPLPTWLSIDPTTGILSGTPLNGDVGSISVTVTASDGTATVDDTFALAVDNTNDGPTVSTVIADQSTNEDAAFSLDITSNFADEDIGDTLTYSATLQNGDPLPTWLSIDATTGILSGTPDNSDVGAINVTVTASDGTATVDDTCSLSVNSNTAPIATADTASVTEQNTIEIDVLANDTDADVGDSLTITGAYVPLGEGSVSIVGNKLVYDPEDDFPDLALNDTQNVAISYTISDGNGGTSSATATVTVTGDDSLIYLDNSSNS